MAKANRISGSFWLVFALIVTVESYRLGLGSLRQPGPGFVFFWAGIFLGVLSLVTLLRTWNGRKAEGAETPIFGGKNTVKVVPVLISVFLYVLFMERLGFILVTLLLLFFLLFLIEKKGWLFAVLVSMAMTCCAHLIFEVWLRSQLPKGLLRFLRF